MKFHKHNLRELLLMSGALLTLASCATQTPSPGTSTGALAPLFCSEAQPILYDRKLDTAATIAQVQAHNAVGVRLCGWTGPAKPQ